MGGVPKFDVRSAVGQLRPRRHVLYVPGMDMKKVAKVPDNATLHVAVLDLEDGVPPAMKDTARSNIREFLKGRPRCLPEMAIRINSLNDRASALDLAAIDTDAIRGTIGLLELSKVESADEVKFADRWLGLHGFNAQILALIETPQGIEELGPISRAAKRVAALVFGAEDFKTASGVGSLAGLAYARGRLVNAARAAGLQAIDMTSLDFRRPPVVYREALETRRMGFTGKQIIHPMQIAPVDRAFVPDQAEQKRLWKFIGDFVGAFYVSGKGVMDQGGTMVELPHVVDAARRLISAGVTVEQLQAHVDKIQG